jgi:hypothetical protein
MDSVKFHPGPPCPTFSGVACQQGGRLAAVYYPLGHPTPYAYDDDELLGTFRVAPMAPKKRTKMFCLMDGMV